MSHLTAYVPELSALIVGLAFVISGISKWFNLGWFAGVVAQYRLLPSTLVKVFALLIPAAELVLGLLLPIQRKPWSAFAALALLIMFTGAVFINLLRGEITIPCGCNGFLKKSRLGWDLFGRNVGLCGLTYLASIPSGGALAPQYSLGFTLCLVCVASAFLPVGSCDKSQGRMVAEPQVL